MNYKKLIVILIISLFFIPTFVYAVDIDGVDIQVTCDGIFTPEALDLVRTILKWVRILAPILLIILIAIDIGGAVLKQDNDLLAKALSKAVKRVIAMLGVIFAPTMVIALSKIAYVDSILGSDPLCTNATGTEAKATVRMAQSKREPENIMYEGVIHNTVGVGTNSSGGGAVGGAFGFGPGNDAKRSYKTVTINGRTYDMYNQGYLSDISFQSGNLAIYGCAPIAFASAVSGFNSSIGAYEAAQMVRSRSFDGIMGALSSAGVGYSGPHYYNSNDRDPAKVAQMVSLVRNHLASGRPAIALVSGGNNGETKYATNNHFITLLGETPDGNVIISNSVEVGNLEEIVTYYLTGGRKGFLLVG